MIALLVNVYSACGNKQVSRGPIKRRLGLLLDHYPNKVLLTNLIAMYIENVMRRYGDDMMLYNQYIESEVMAEITLISVFAPVVPKTVYHQFWLV